MTLLKMNKVCFLFRGAQTCIQLIFENSSLSIMFMGSIVPTSKKVLKDMGNLFSFCSIFLEFFYFGQIYKTASVSCFLKLR